MVYTTAGRNSRCQLRDRCADEGVVQTGNDELVQDTRWTAIEDRDTQTPTEGDPGVVNGEGEATNRQEAILSLELVLVAGRVDNMSILAYDRHPAVI